MPENDDNSERFKKALLWIKESSGGPLGPNRMVYVTWDGNRTPLGLFINSVLDPDTEMPWEWES